VYAAHIGKVARGLGGTSGCRARRSCRCRQHVRRRDFSPALMMAGGRRGCLSELDRVCACLVEGPRQAQILAQCDLACRGSGKPGDCSTCTSRGLTSMTVKAHGVARVTGSCTSSENEPVRQEVAWLRDSVLDTASQAYGRGTSTCAALASRLRSGRPSVDGSRQSPARKLERDRTAAATSESSSSSSRLSARF